MSLTLPRCGSYALAVAAEIALSGCAPHAAPAPERVDPLASARPPSAGEARSTPVVKHACAYELAGEPTAVVARMTRPAGAVAGGKVLLAYQQNKGLTTSIRARLFEAAAPPGLELAISPQGGVYTQADVIAHGARFFVTWRKERSPEKSQGRWVEADGALGPVIDLPFDDLWGVGLLPHESGFVGAYSASRDHGDTLYRVLLDANLKPATPPLAIDDAQYINGLSIAQLALASGDIWVTAEGKGRRGARGQIHLVRMSASGTVIGTVDEVSISKLDAMLPALVEVPDGVLIAWLEFDRNGTTGTVWTRKLDANGKPLGPPIEVGAGGGEWDGLELVLDAGEPLLITRLGHNIRLDANGAKAAAATAVEPRATKSIWLSTSPRPALAWADHGDNSALMFARLECSRDTVGPR